MITFDKSTKTFFLDGKGITYAFFINEQGYAQHLYFGRKIGHDDLRSFYLLGGISYLTSLPGCGVKENPLGKKVKSYNNFPTEFSFFGTGDYREPAFSIVEKNGNRLCDLLFDGYEIVSEKPKISNMPSLRDGETLILHMKDKITKFSCDLYYTVYEDCSVIARRAVYKNTTGDRVNLTRAYSFSMSLPENDYDIVSLYGNWGKERHIDRTPMHRGVFSVDSKRGTSSATLSPFLAVVDKETTEEFGDAYGINLIYSSSYVLKVEGTNDGRTLLTGGVNDFNFCWVLDKDECFETPEVMLCYSGEGLGGMSREFHDCMRDHLINPAYAKKSRPIVINNWEGTYFNFDAEKLRNIANAVKDTGIDTFVLDDGWFGARNSALAGLGDWVVNEKKLEGGLVALSDYIHSLGMKFGLWFEPEMVNEDSDLFRNHPDYAMGAPNHPRCYARYQFILDLTREDVRDYIVNAVNKVLREVKIDYVKWDCNRNVTEFYSLGLPPEREGEVAHRYALGLYDIFDRIVNANPNIFFEGCSSGGGRFDCGVLYYFPQIWTSDDTDAEERTLIQYGTSVVYPLSAMSCHVSAIPNHQTGRKTDFETRGDIAHLGSTGYELDTTKFTDEDVEKTHKQVEKYREIEDLILCGDLYRTENPFKSNYFGFCVVSKNREKAVLTVYRRLGSTNNEVKYFKVRGLDPEKNYSVSGIEGTFKGSTLMSFGLPERLPGGDFKSKKYMIYEVK